MELIAQERILWAALTDEERAQEQEALLALWGSRKARRRVSINPAWGKWAEGLGEILVPNTAFGIPSNDFRPYDKAPSAPIDSLSTVVWLHEHGFQVADVTDGVYTLVVSVPRAAPEVDRLLGLIARKNPNQVHPWGSSRGGVQMRATYDPCLGGAVIEVRGI